ncbi:DUF3710 domain-containing protein [Naumannella halotolerans]|uniref:Uncharacterized protein DUF3710 n=1 Tax=Naumannella halotolerans TaxID=993414 RepID=A0A4R7J7J7_9ACTN|nr:DUF3710 domain-containing protein [Naumannella halotolerans]TDT33234.1 uncharacterized protein DUF3710 [Naumannella halotolerans]
MIFGRKRKADKSEETAGTDLAADVRDEDETADTATSAKGLDDRDGEDTENALPGAGSEDSDGEAAGADDVSDEESTEGTDEESDEESAAEEADRVWAELDQGDFRDEGPFDIDEVDLTDDPVERIDLGSLIITPFKGAELRLNVLENTRKVVSVLIAKDDSALELSVFAAPNSGGMWADVRTKLIEETERAGGSVKLVEGPFGTELRRLLPAKGPKGEQGVQPSRTWMAQGPRWALRGVLYGRAALAEDLEADPVAPFFDAFRDVIVRRGEGPQRAGEVLAMSLPEGVQQRGPAASSPGPAASAPDSADGAPTSTPDSPRSE